MNNPDPQFSFSILGTRVWFVRKLSPPPLATVIVYPHRLSTNGDCQRTSFTSNVPDISFC
ncbi:hypothetical protein M413DRAFT_448112 [Hebeloma cylindrosporum]|uniref:Uncharacterized protein n=1 Tax=Hebeloma cylindrosporum TaxID=76867 RepID=A0A0C2YAT7_HEBCY|nr:hypothetical protein M413DRAFT_448112 [Hebeloma cylindrosporum h7]